MSRILSGQFLRIALCLGMLGQSAVCASCALPPQGAKAVARKMRLAIRQLDADPETGDKAVVAVEAMAAWDGKPGAIALLDAANTLAGMAAPIVEKRRKGLRKEGGSGRLKRTRYELRSVDDTAEAIARTLAKMRSPAALAAMLQRLTDKGSSLPLWLRLELAGRVADLPKDKLNWRSRGRKPGDAETTIALLATAAGLGQRAGDVCGGWVAQQLQHENEDVRIRAAAALGLLAWPAGIELLIARLEHEEGEVREALLDGLTVLTGQDPGDSGASWRAWLQAEGAPYVGGKKPLSKGDASIRKRDTSSSTVSGSYFGIEQTGDSILYVFDNSLSMRAKLKKAAGSKGQGAAPKPITRWDLCRAELKQALRGLRPGQKFNLVSFANKARSFASVMQPVTPKNISQAVAWIEDLKLELQTNVFDALELGFLIAGRGSGDRYYASEVDTMFFLSDGAPTIPKLGRSGMGPDDSDRILAAVQRWNALGRVHIHAVGIGLPNRKKDRNKKGALWPTIFLKKLAEQNGGRFVLRR
mgnify:FL=1